MLIIDLYSYRMLLGIINLLPYRVRPYATGYALMRPIKCRAPPSIPARPKCVVIGYRRPPFAVPNGGDDIG